MEPESKPADQTGRTVGVVGTRASGQGNAAGGAGQATLQASHTHAVTASAQDLRRGHRDHERVVHVVELVVGPFVTALHEHASRESRSKHAPREVCSKKVL